jgi:hypothetical protein
MIDPKGLLMIEPKSAKCEPTLIDPLTMKMAGALKHASRGVRSRGFHCCACGVISGNCELFVELDGKPVLTNSLAVHYLACHRSEVPYSEIEKVERLEYAYEVPGAKRIARPRNLMARSGV